MITAGFFDSFYSVFSVMPFQVKAITVLMILLTISFLWKYLIKGIILYFRLSSLLHDLKKFRESGRIDPSEIFTLKRGKDVFHLWHEYRDTLYEKKRVNPETGEEEIHAITSNVPAETYFTPQAIVDSRLSADFFRHLPGIFTGLGIIGTFSGLIKGLKAFNVSENTEIVRKSLENLLAGVSEAFIVSACAIGLAMFVTIVEKSLLSALHRKIEQLCYLIDSFFETGSGEEYLERLVKVSEDSLQFSGVLKDSLVGDLRQIMFDMNQKQISAFNEQISVFAQASLAGQREFGEKLAKTIEAAISKPLADIAEGFRIQRERTGDDLSSALNDVLSSFTRGNQDMFEGQITGINALQNRTLNGLESVLGKLEKMMSDINEAGRGGADAVASKLADAVSSMESRQQLMNARMGEFVDQIKNLVSQSQTETARKLQELLSDLGQQVSLMVSELKKQSMETSEFHNTRQTEIAYSTANSMNSMQSRVQGFLDVMERQQDKFTERTENSLKQLSETFEKSIAGMGKTVSVLGGIIDRSNENASSMMVSMQLAASDLREFTGNSVAEMNEGARTLLASAGEFTRLVQGFSALTERITSISREMTVSAGTLAGSSDNIQAVSADFRNISQNLASLLESSVRIIDAARREASLTEKIISGIEASSEKLSDAQMHAEQILASVSDVKTETHTEFSSGMRSTLKEVNSQFFDHMTDAVAKLREGIEEFEATVGRIGRD
jgi:ElaB/YqjD/DUF883 family membrane-anchored ribosome-binding protein